MDVLLLLSGQPIETLDDPVGFAAGAAVCPDRPQQIGRATVSGRFGSDDDSGRGAGDYCSAQPFDLSAVSLRPPQSKPVCIRLRN